jgi:uncharacterized membrane protein
MLGILLYALPGIAAVLGFVVYWKKTKGLSDRNLFAFVGLLCALAGFGIHLYVILEGGS